MSLASLRFVLKPVAFVFLAAGILPAAVTPQKHIVVTEGTNVEVAVSPDRKTILADIQGIYFSIPFAGGTGKQVTSVIQEASNADWSKTGGFVAIQSYAGGTFHIWTMRPDGSNLKQITFGHGDDREPRISPDGKTIAFTSDRAFEGSYDLWTIDIASGKLKQVTTAPADEFGPNWSPDGKGLAFISGTGAVGKSIEYIDLGNMQQHTVISIDPKTGHLEAPSFSPDGTKLAYIHVGGLGMFMDTAVLEVAPAAGGDPIYTGKGQDAFPFAPVWLSNDEFVYTGQGKILDTKLSAGTETAIPFSAGIPAIRPAYAKKHYDFDSTATRTVKGIYAPAISPNGKQVAFVALNQLYLMPIGGKPVALTHDNWYKQGPAWSPDGKTLAYVTDKNGIENVFLHDTSTSDDSSDHVAYAAKTAQIMPAWSPDSKMIAYQDQTGATLYIDLEHGTVKPIAPSTFFPGRASFAPNGKTVLIATIKPYTKRFREGTSAILSVDLASMKTQYFSPAQYESVTTRTEDGPIYAPNGKEIAFVMDDLLYTMPVDAAGNPTGKAVALNKEVTDAPTYSGDSKHILYLSDGKLRMIDRATHAVTPVPVDLTYKPAINTQKVQIHAARFWKGQGPNELKDVDILISGTRIVSVKPHSLAPPAPGVRVIEAGDSTVMPGLWESHVHADSDNGIYYGDRMGRLWLSYGVTELKGVADNAYRGTEHRESYLAGASVGPRVFNTGEAVDGERVYYPMMIPTTSEAQLHREWERLKALDFDLIKLYVRLPFSWVAESTKFAHEQMGVATAGHYLIPEVSLGEDGMTHISATSRWGWAYSRSVAGHSYSDVQKLLVDSGMWTISTTFAQAQYLEFPDMVTDPRQAIAPPWENKRIQTSMDTSRASNQASAYMHLKDEEATVANDFRKGGMILAGTDSPLDVPATSLHLNLRAQVKYGLEPWQALETATFLPAKAFGLEKDLGTLDPGHLADLIITSGDPLKDINDVMKVKCVMKGGTLWSLSQVAAPFTVVDTGNDICPAK